MTQFKICGDCGKNKKKTEYYKDSKGVDGLRSYCKKCHKKRHYKYAGWRGLFYDEIILKQTKKYKHVKIEMCGYKVGILVYIDDHEIMAYSNIRGFKMVKCTAEGKLFLYNQAIKAGKRISQVMSERARKMLKKLDKEG